MSELQLHRTPAELFILKLRLTEQEEGHPFILITSSYEFLLVRSEFYQLNSALTTIDKSFIGIDKKNNIMTAYKIF